VTKQEDNSDQSKAYKKIFQGDGSKQYGTSVLKEAIPDGDAKINKGRFVDPQIKGLLDEQFHFQLNEQCGNHSKLLAETTVK
jgi:hypothetical protein